MEMLVVISIITMLMSILLPSLEKARVTARRSKCLSQIRQMTIANQNYMDDYIETFPPHRDHDINAGRNWNHLLEDYGMTPEAYHCPELGGIQTDYGVDWQWSYDFNYIGYGYNGFFLGYYSHAAPNTNGTYIPSVQWTKMNMVRDATKLIVFADSHPKSSNGVNNGVSLTLWWPFINRHTEGINGRRHEGAGIVGFADTHGEIVPDPETSLQPGVDGTSEHIEFWDPLQRYP